MDKHWEHVVVLGAAGKMGSGIALLLLQEIAFMKGSALTLLDTNPLAFEGLKKYLREHTLKYAERNINRLRRHYEERHDLIDNEEMIQAFVEEGLDPVRFVTSFDECKDASMIFEAIVEDVEIKVILLSKISEIASTETFYFSNTSSIPIHILQKSSHLEGRLIGLHFYNPPAIQKLLEIIVPEKIAKNGLELALDIGKRLNKTVVFSKDVAGFIGNGHFIREMVEACGTVEKLCERIGLTEALCFVNAVTQDYLIRPMGIFQLIDYVGIDVVKKIAQVMSDYLSDQNFSQALINDMILAGVKGGQNGDGSQKDGFFAYEKGKPVKVFDLEKRKYIPYHFIEELKVQETWKNLSKDKDKNQKLDQHFAHLAAQDSMASRTALQFLECSSAIAHGLVKDGVALSIEDVDIVLQNGFFHLYGVNAPLLAIKKGG